MRSSFRRGLPPAGRPGEIAGWRSVPAEMIRSRIGLAGINRQKMSRITAIIAIYSPSPRSDEETKNHES
jgi:hypothetical protein